METLIPGVGMLCGIILTVAIAVRLLRVHDASTEATPCTECESNSEAIARLLVTVEGLELRQTQVVAQVTRNLKSASMRLHRAQLTEDGEEDESPNPGVVSQLMAAADGENGAGGRKTGGSALERKRASR